MEQAKTRDPCAIFISFDGVAISGITVEAVKIAKQLKASGIKSYLDLGYDIKVDKGNFNKPYNDEHSIYQGIFTLTRIDAINDIPDYNVDFILRIRDIFIQQKKYYNLSIRQEMMHKIEQATHCLARRIIECWEKLAVRYVFVENGTLPENIIYTKALYLAIEEYGRRYQSGKFVIWRDHDLMWNSEQSRLKYGHEPYAFAIKPIKSEYITYITLNRFLKDKMESWCNNEIDVEVRKNTYDFSRPTEGLLNIRKSFSINDEDILIARTTRIIPQKRIDRDIYLVYKLNDFFVKNRVNKKVYLIIAGDTTEDVECYEHLQVLINQYNISSCVKFTGILQHDYMPLQQNKITIEDLYFSCDLVSFLTSWDYDSYGNPVGEAISSQRCYITTNYEYYHEVYGQYGFEAPVMDISKMQDGIPDDNFIMEIYELINNKKKMHAVAERNYLIGKEILANSVVDALDINPSGGTMKDTIFISIVLPVFNESDRINAVLNSIFHQQTEGDLITHDSYELIIVDNNSQDDSVKKIAAFKEHNPSLSIHLIKETTQGVSSARKCGMDYASLRAKARDYRLGVKNKHYIVSADADCEVDAYWLHALIRKMIDENGDLGTCNYWYDKKDFLQRPHLFNEITKTLRCRDYSFSLFGGFPDGKGFAVDRDMYDKVGGIEIFYQLDNGRFVEHLSDDWDFGIKTIAYGAKPVYAKSSYVKINSRRVDTILDEVIGGTAYGQDGIIIMKDIRPEADEKATSLSDITAQQSSQAWFYSIKDYAPKNIILPVLLNPSLLLDDQRVRAFFTVPVADALYQRIHEIKNETRIIDYKSIHAYKTPCYRLFFEFRDEIFSALRREVGEDIGYAPPLPDCLRNIPPEDFKRFVFYYCEDRESGEAHNYFANGGVF